MVKRLLLALTAVAALGAMTAALARAEDQPFDGEKLFATTCGWCHQSGGRVAGRGPKLAGTQRSDDFIIERIKNGKPGAMPGFATTFDDKKINAILGYIRGLKDEAK